MNGRGFRLGAQQSVLQTANGLELLAGKADPVSFFWQSRQQRPIEGWMGTDRRRQRPSPVLVISNPTSKWASSTA